MPIGVDRCQRCGELGRGERWEYEYGLRRRYHSPRELRLGITPRDLREGFRLLGREELFLCRRCERRLILRTVVSRPSLILIVGALGAIGHLGVAEGVSFVLLSALVGSAVLLFAARFDRGLRLRAAFSCRRAALARSERVPAGQLVARPPRSTAREEPDA